MRHLFVMDPVEKLDVAGDSTYVCMREACDRGQKVSWCTPDKLYVRNGTPYAVATHGRVVSFAPWFLPERTEEVALEEHAVIWMRKDPPFDMDYIFSTYVLDLVPGHVVQVNAPAGLKLFNEKIWAMHFARFQPDTLLSNDLKRLRQFVDSQPDGAVLKPWDGNGGRGVVITRKGDRNLPSLLELMTAGGRSFCIAQAFLRGVSEGDKRILLFEGDPVGAVLRVPGSEDHRANLHVGGRARATEITERDREICAAIGPELRKYGQIFVGIDVIAGTLTEINLTSPTGLRQVAALYGDRLEVDLLDRVERLVQQRASGAPAGRAG
jgi:glutathione synthase